MVKPTIEALSQVLEDQSLIAVELFCRQYVCGECGGELTILYHRETSEHIATCGVDHDHSGFERTKSYTEKYKAGELIHPAIKNRIERREERNMEEEIGREKAAELAPYLSVKALTQEQATTILKSIWPDAPDIDVYKAALTCVSYGLNPLKKHLFLIPFKNRETGEITYTQVLGIGATRLIASRYGGYSYADGPRLMTTEEQRMILGEVDEDNLWAITIIKDLKGNKAPGYGSWPKNKEPKGTEKGNTKANMAFIRSERNAFDRLLPGEMPAHLEVVDETAVALPIPHIEAEVEHGGGESTEEGTPTEPIKNEASQREPILQPEGDDQPRPPSRSEEPICLKHSVLWIEGRWGPYHYINEGKENCTPAKLVSAYADQRGWKQAEITKWMRGFEKKGLTMKEMDGADRIKAMEAFLET